MTWISLFVFASVLLAGLGIISKKGSFALQILIEEQKTRPKITDRVPFMDSLWNVTDATRDAAWKTALAGTLLGLLIGLAVQSTFGILFAAAGFVLAPRIRSNFELARRKNAIRKLLPRIVADISAVTRTSTLLDAFAQVAQEYPPPAGDVFKYIHQGMVQGLGAHEAVKRAVDLYDLPELQKLVDAVRIITELGGGERVTETLSAAADQVKFQERFFNKARIAISEIVNETIYSNVIVIGFFLLFASDPGSEYRRAITEHPAVILCGLAAMAAGWLMVRSKLNGFKSRCGL